MRYKNWTKEEDAILKDKYCEYGIDYCMLFLERSRRSIEERRKKLKIKSVYSTDEKYYKHNLEPVVLSSYTYWECLDKLGIKNKGASYSTIKKYILKYGLDTSHFKNGISLLKKEKPLKEILVENSTYSRKSLKKRLYKEGLKVNNCEMCGQGEMWNGKKMSLIIDHINGINNDNRIENLRILCPNCNATLKTHCRGTKIK